jgi:hypothetical protein
MHRRSRLPLNSHRNPIKRPHSQKLREGASEARRQLQNDEQHEVEDHDPLASIAIRYRAEHQRSHRSQHESYGNALCSVSSMVFTAAKRTDTGRLTQVTSEFSTPKSRAISVTVNETVKKSKASHVLDEKVSSLCLSLVDPVSLQHTTLRSPLGTSTTGASQAGVRSRSDSASYSSEAATTIYA